MVVKVHTLDNMTPQELAEHKAKLAAWEAGKAERDLELLRQERDRILKNNDAFFSAGHPLNSEAMNNYRQALLDITQQYASLDEVVWPTNPLDV